MLCDAALSFRVTDGARGGLRLVGSRAGTGPSSGVAALLPPAGPMLKHGLSATTSFRVTDRWRGLRLACSRVVAAPGSSVATLWLVASNTDVSTGDRALREADRWRCSARRLANSVCVLFSTSSACLGERPPAVAFNVNMFSVGSTGGNALRAAGCSVTVVSADNSALLDADLSRNSALRRAGSVRVGVLATAAWA